jgi:hypothetical protein
MPLSPQPFHLADHALPTSDEGERSFREWSRHVGDPALNGEQGLTSLGGAPTIDWGHPLVKVAAVAFVGYTLGRIIHRR